VADGAAVSASLIGCFEASAFSAKPFRHWLLSDILPVALCDAIDALPVRPPKIEDTEGKRRRHPVCDALAAGFQSAATVARIERLCAIELRDKSHLRIEYCLDTDGFWLEPHTDIGAKLFTMLVYLSTEPGSEEWGTDILDANLNLVAVAPYKRNCGLIFVPGGDTWHGFRRRPIQGVRRSLIVNYVKPEWRSRHELAYPDHAAGA
jgi:hypothetical protein